MNGKITALLFVIAAIFIAASQSLYTVDQTQQAIVLQLGKPVGDIKGPGLHVKIPVIQEVKYFDRRILAVDPEPEQVVIASSSIISGKNEIDSNLTSGEPIIVDTFVRYKITDPLQFMKTLRTTYDANQRIESIMNDATRTVLGKVTMIDLLSTKRAKIMEEIKKDLNSKVHEDGLGIEIVDTRIVRADLTSDLRTSTVRRMNSELKAKATETRAKGEEKALEIRSTADKERSVIIANAQRDSSIIRGEGDEKAIKIYADAFNKDKEFYAFSRTLEAYQNTLSNPETKLILSPSSDFFRYFGDIKGSK